MKKLFLLPLLASFVAFAAHAEGSEGHAPYANNPTIRNILDVQKPDYSSDEAMKVVKQEIELSAVLMSMNNKEEAIRHIEMAKSVAGENNDLAASLDGLIGDLNGGSLENAKQRMSEILAQ